jgi:predicted ATPase/DNA-binding SARP family transcriptional activator
MGGGERVRVEVLGPIRVLDAAGADVTPPGVLQRRLLALLVLRRDRVVSAGEAIEALWPDRPPGDATAALHNQVSRLRRRLPTGIVSSTGDGYVLASARVEVDADGLAAAVHGGERDRATLAALDAVLERWQGGAYPELADVDHGRIEAARLEELRVRALEVRAECRLEVGEVDAVVPELARLVDEHPLRERPRALLMAALERSGRRVDALRAYDDFRRLLGDELGIEPSPALAAQHRALLDGPPAPDAPVPDRTTAAPAAPAATAASRLPVPATPLVGRDALVDEAVAATGAHRVVTLVGPAGVGKTRLAVEVGHRLRTADGAPVAMCELAATGPATAVEHVAAGLGIDPRADTDLADRIAEVLGDSPLVLVLDGCEHVLDPLAGLVERVVARCPAVRVLATSQERLRVPGERVLPVPSLPCGGEGAAAVQLFVERARAAAPGFDPTASDAATVAEIARRLDGLPLAIELAAARLHTHELAEVVAGLDERFSLLSTGYRTSARHGSLRAAVSWSFDLLDERLRRVFTDVSVFAGPFSAADAAAVCELTPPVSGDDLAQLVERSLVGRAEGGRYALLETLRAFGAERLAATGDDATVRDRHARHFVAWVEDADRRMLDGPPDALVRLDAAVPDLRVALDRLLAEGLADLAGRLVVSLRDYGFLRQRPDVLIWARRVADADPDRPDGLTAVVWATSAYGAWMVGDPAGTADCTERARTVGEAAGGPLPADVATMCGSLALFDGRLDDAASWYRRGADLAAAVGDTPQRLVSAASEVLALAYAGDAAARDRADELLAEVGDSVDACSAYVWYCAGEADLGVDDERARARLTQAIALAESSGASFVVGVAGASRASIDARIGDRVAAAEAYRWLIPHWRRAGVWSTQWTMLRSIAVLLDRMGRHRDAAVLEGAVRATAAGHRIFGADEALLAELGARLRASLGDAEYEAARAEGARFDGDAAADHALRALALA